MRSPHKGGFLLAAVLIVSTFPLLQSAAWRITRVAAVPLYKPALVEMAPVTLEPGEPASLFIDREPAAIGVHAPEYHALLTGETKKDYSEDKLLENLEGSKNCADLIRSSMGGDQDDPPRPAACLTAIEARLFCEVRGKRLPTSDEWRAAFGDGRTVVGHEQQPVTLEPPAYGGEWVMDLNRDNPVFKVMGLPLEHPAARSTPTGWSREVGFRCAYRFEE